MNNQLCPFCNCKLYIGTYLKKCLNHNDVMVITKPSQNRLILCKKGAEIDKTNIRIKLSLYHPCDEVETKFFYFNNYLYLHPYSQIVMPCVDINLHPATFDENYNRLKKLVTFS